MKTVLRYIFPQDLLTRTTSSGVLNSLRLYDALRLNATAITRYEGSNIDHLMTPMGEEIPLCHLSSLIPFSEGNFVPDMIGFEFSVSVALAAHHLNTGNGVIIPEVEGLNKECKIRFTTEFVDTQYSESVAMELVSEQIERELGSLTARNPCAFIGPDRSAVSIPTSIVTGRAGYPQISAQSTSVALDDKDMYPLFGRTVPSDEGNTVPIVRFLREVFNIKHLAIINVNDSYGNNFAEGMRKAAEIYAPDMTLIQIPIDEEEGAAKAAITSVKKTGYRFIFALVFGVEAHDALLTEAYKQGIAGTGVHNWIFPDSFVGTLTDRTFTKGSILHKVYSGTGLIEMSGGLPGIPSFDKYQSQMKQVLNPTDLQYFGSIWPRHDHPNWGTETPFISSDAFLADVAASSSSFYYEAAISLGLAACEAYKDNKAFSGQDHYDSFRNLTFSGISGKVSFDPISGTRTEGSVMYKASNFIAREVDQDTVEFLPVVSSTYYNESWEERVPYLFNDGTSRLPLDMAPPQSESKNIFLSVFFLMFLSAMMILCFIVWMYNRLKKKGAQDLVWEVREGDLKFSDPPKVVGQGKTGLVLLADYRGTVVAVKRVLAPPPAPPTKMKSYMHGTSDTDLGNHTILGSDRISPGTVETSRTDGSGRSSNDMLFRDRDASWGKMSSGAFGQDLQGSADVRLGMFGKLGLAESKRMTSTKRIKCAFIDEIRYLSKLRHPCITTIMGKCACENNNRCSS